jgi:hypothetical protein
MRSAAALAAILYACAPRPAASEVVFEIGWAQAAPGETASVPIIYASREAPLTHWALVIRYDPSALAAVEVVSARAADRFEFTGPDSFLAAGRVHAEASCSFDAPPADGDVVAWLRFCVAGGAAPGEHPIDSIRFAARNAGTLESPVKDRYEASTARIALDLPEFPVVRPGGVVVLDVPPPAGACLPDAHLEDLVPVASACPAAARTDLCSLEVESASGAVGDMVGVTVLLRSRLSGEIDFFAVEIDLCHDPAVVEPAGRPVFGDDLLSMVGLMGLEFATVDEDVPPAPDNPEYAHKGHGCHASISFRRGAYGLRFPSEVPLPIMTLWYRVKGMPGDVSPLSFRNEFLERPPLICLSNSILVNQTERRLVETWDGSVTVIEGAAAHPDRPPEPPDAQVYPSLPSAEEIGFQVEVRGARARPGDREVPVEVYARADVDFTAIQVPIAFDPLLVRLARAEDHGITGAVLFDRGGESPAAGPGHAVVAIGAESGTGRLAAAGERLHAATLWFDVLAAAAGVESTALEIVPVTGAGGSVFAPWIGVRYRDGTGGYGVVTARVEPIRIADGRVTILPEVSLFVRGDANLDGVMDVSDPVTVLGFLFLGDLAMPCPDAADTNDDGKLDVTDPVASLASLFLCGHGMHPPFPAPGTDPTPDDLDCR